MPIFQSQRNDYICTAFPKQWFGSALLAVTEEGEALSGMEKWCVVQTRFRWEKKVAESLSQRGFDCVCPVQKVQRRWSDRIKTLDEPLFRSCVFVKLRPEHRTAVRLTEGVVNFLYRQGKALVVRDRDIEWFRQYQHGEASPTGRATTELYAQQQYLAQWRQRLAGCFDRPKLV